MDLNPNELEVLRLMATRPYDHRLLPLPQRLRMGRLLAEGLVRLERPDIWTITELGLTALKQQHMTH